MAESTTTAHRTDTPSASTPSSKPEPLNRPFAIERVGQSTDDVAGVDAEGNAPARTCLAITRGLRTSGFLQDVPAIELKNLLLLLTFLTPGGQGGATLQQLAHWMRVSETKTRVRLQRLTKLYWHGQPLVREVRRRDGQWTYIPSSSLFAGLSVTQEASQPPSATSPKSTLSNASPEPSRSETELDLSSPSLDASEPPLDSLSMRDRVISHSRTRYARPRREVERDLAARMGWPYPSPSSPSSQAQPQAEADTAGELAPRSEEEAIRQLRRDLIKAGLNGRTADDLIAQFDLARIRRQLMWLTYRKAKNPARFLIAAIQDDYEAPRPYMLTKGTTEPRTAVGVEPLEDQPPNTDAPEPLPGAENQPPDESRAR